MIDPVRHGADAAARSIPTTSVGSAPARINPIGGVRMDELAVALAAGPQLSPAQSKQIVALLRATLESFGAPVRTEQAGGSLGALQAATVSLGQLQEDLAARLTRHQDQQQSLAPILRALMASASGADVAEAAALAGSKSSSAIGTGASSVTALAHTLAEAMARLEETLGAAGPAATRSPRQAPEDRPPPFGQSSQGERPPANHGTPPTRADPVGAFRWLLDSAMTLTTAPARPVATPGEVVRLTSLAHALLDALATRPLPPNVLTDVEDPEDASPLQGDLWVTLDRFPGVKLLLGPILRELGLAQLAPGSGSADVLAAAIARVQLLAVIVLAEAEGVAAPGLYRQILAECEAAGMPPFTSPVDSDDNIETYRWLLIAAQLYNSRVPARPPLQRCTRCGRTLQRSRTGMLVCPSCS